MVTIKSKSEIEKMREAGRLLALVHEEMAKHIRPGISTMELNDIGDKKIRSFGCIPSFLNYDGYPASICISVNEEVVHGIPGKRKIKDGDIIEIDIPSRSINVKLSDEELATRPQQPLKRNRVVSKALRAYAQSVSSADKGGIRIID